MSRFRGSGWGGCLCPLAVASLVCEGLRFLMVAGGTPLPPRSWWVGSGKGGSSDQLALGPGRGRSGKGELALGA